MSGTKSKKPSIPLLKLIKQVLCFALQSTSWVNALLGLTAMEGFFHLAPKVGLSKIDYAALNGTHFLPSGKKASFLGEVIFYTGAVGWVSVFRSLKHKLKGPPSIKSAKFGTALFLFSSLAVMPLLGFTNPYMRQGVLKKPGLFGLGLDGWKTPVSNFIGHLLFSQVIGIKRLNKS